MGKQYKLYKIEYDLVLKWLRLIAIAGLLLSSLILVDFNSAKVANEVIVDWGRSRKTRSGKSGGSSNAQRHYFYKTTLGSFRSYAEMDTGTTLLVERTQVFHRAINILRVLPEEPAPKGSMMAERIETSNIYTSGQWVLYVMAIVSAIGILPGIPPEWRLNACLASGVIQLVVLFFLLSS